MHPPFLTMATKNTTRRPKSRPRKKQPNPPNRSFKVLLAALFLVGFLVVSLLLLTFVQRPATQSVVRDHRVPVESPSPLSPHEQDHLLLTSVQLCIERALWQQGISFSGMDISKADGVTHYQLSAQFPGKSWYEELTQRLSRESSLLGVEFGDAPGNEVEISLRGTPQFLLSFKRIVDKPVPVRPKARIAIIVDDLGRDLHALRDFLSIDLDLTMAVMPEEPHTRKTAELAHRSGREVIVHMPMEPVSYPRNNPGPGALLLGQDTDEIKRRVAVMFQKVPHAVGGNNHMGSRFTQYPEGMAAVFEIMKAGGWFFVDSRTSPGSVIRDEARRARMSFASRDVFLDNEQNVEAISRQLREVVKLARSRRRAIAICHPYPETVKALRQEAAFLQQQDLEVVPVSHLLRR